MFVGGLREFFFSFWLFLGGVFFGAWMLTCYFVCVVVGMDSYCEFSLFLRVTVREP